MHKTTKEEMDVTGNRCVYNRLRKQYLNKKGLIRCSLCGYHKNENTTPYYHRKYRSWKEIKRTQWDVDLFNFNTSI